MSKLTSMQQRIADAPGRPAERGVILIITLIVLAAMTLASLAMIRSVDTATLIAGNVSFKQSATNSADAAINAAMKAMKVIASEADAPASGYYATRHDGDDFTGNKTTVTTDDIDWEGNTVAKMPADKAGNTFAYVIHRLCDNVGPVDPDTCSVVPKPKLNPSLGSSDPSERPGETEFNMGPGTPYYRVTMRVRGPKGTTSFVQAIVSQKREKPVA